jgi:putative membrane protein
MKKHPPLLLACSMGWLSLALSACTHVSLAEQPPATPVATVVAPSPTTVMGAPRSMSATDRDFATTAAISGMSEVAASQLALTHASDPQVMAFARTMIQQHGAANDQLTAIMRARGVNPPTALPKTQVDEMGAFGMRSGPDFDRYFIQRAGVQAHQDAIIAFQRQMPQLTDPDLKAWAANTLPVMQQHLSMAQDIAGRIAG